MYWLFGDPSLFAFLDAKLPKPGCTGRGPWTSHRAGFPALSYGGRRGRRVSGGAGGEWEEGMKCKFLNGKINK